MNSVDFIQAMAALPEPPNDSQPPHWNFWRHQLWQLGQAEDVNTFWKWPPIYHTMLVNHFPIGHQLLYLQEDWSRWYKVVSDPDNETNQRNLINQAYHLRKWEEVTNTRVEELESIVEFGAGYGAMALICHRLGFTGQYDIVDLPEFALLQQWWLGIQDVAVRHISEPKESDLFIGIYSISEIPPDERNQWLRAESYLFLSSSQFDTWDNLTWLGELMLTHPELHWYEERFEPRPDYYLIGWPK